MDPLFILFCIWCFARSKSAEGAVNDIRARGTKIDVWRTSETRNADVPVNVMYGDMGGNRGIYVSFAVNDPMSFGVFVVDANGIPRLVNKGSGKSTSDIVRGGLLVSPVGDKLPLRML